MLGQIRYSTKVVLNIKVNYLPKSLLQSRDCNDRCSQVLVATVLNGDQPTSVKSSYISSSRFTFTVELEFGKPYINKFTVEIKVLPSLASYFGSVSITKKVTFDVIPSKLALAKSDNEKAW
jgi:hypothetical protein